MAALQSVERLRVRGVDAEASQLMGADTAAGAEVEAAVGHLPRDIW
jgi:hypothetical protein